jgi:prepilin-type N-terminal cleavage/methylation domain-containing protein
MCTAGFYPASRCRHGITLIEVLICIGILAIGLTSVMSLIPAGKSEAGRALVYDRATAMAMNGLADAVAFGLTRPDSFVSGTSTATTVVFDPANLSTDSWSGVSTTTSGTLKAAGVLAAASSLVTASLPLGTLFAQGRDDIAYNPPATDDDLPTNGFINGIRGFDGRMTSIIALTEADTGTPPLAAGDLATLSVIVFHKRDTSTPTMSGSMDSSGLVTLTTALPNARTLKSVMRPGAVLFYVDPATSRLRFAQLSMAAVDTDKDNTYVTFTGRPGPNSTVNVTLLVDSVGLAEQTVALEGPSPYGL